MIFWAFFSVFFSSIFFSSDPEFVSSISFFSIFSLFFILELTSQELLITAHDIAKESVKLNRNTADTRMLRTRIKNITMREYKEL